MIRPPSTAVQKPSTWKLRSSWSASHEVSSSIRALTTSVNRPSVRMNSGSVSSFTTGLTRKFTRPKSSATRISVSALLARCRHR